MTIEFQQPVVVSGEGDFGVLVDDRLSLFPSREQAMAYVRWCLSLGLAPELWVAEKSEALAA